MLPSKTRRNILGGFCFWSMFGGTAWAAPVCPQHAEPAGLALITDVMATGRFVAYQPTSQQMYDGKPTLADPTSMVEDLAVLRGRFDGLITYSSKNGVERVPEIAAKLGYRAVIMGVWDVADPLERGNVLSATRAQKIVAGVSLGNETVYGKRASFADLAQAMAQFRNAAPGLAVATTEPFHLLLGPPAAPALAQSDLILANVHPAFEPWFTSAPAFNAAEFVVNVSNMLAQGYCGPVLVKETGAPTAPADLGFSPARQAEIYRELQRQFPPTSMKAFAYFSAYDAPWRRYDAHPTPGAHPEEAHWGLYDEKRRPKAVVDVIAPLLSRR